MCKTLIEMHHLKITFNENDVEDMFSKIIGMRFSTIAMVEKWIFEKLQATKKSLPNFVLQESEINDEILFGDADVDLCLMELSERVFLKNIIQIFPSHI